MARRITVTTEKKIRALDAKNLIPLWLQSTAYVIGSLVVAPINGTYKEADGQVWRCITAHTSGTGEAPGKDWADDTAYWTRSQAGLAIRQGAYSQERLVSIPTGQTAANYRKDVSNLGSKLVAPAGAWDQATAYVIGDVGTEPSGYTVAAGHTYSKKYRCIVAHTSSTGGASHAADFATDLAAGKWEELTAGKPITLTVYDQKTGEILGYKSPTNGGIEGEVSEGVGATKGAVTITNQIGETLGKKVDGSQRPLTDAIMDDLDERLQPDPTLSNEQLIYTYEDIYGNLLNFISAQTITSPIARLIGVKKE